MGVSEAGQPAWVSTVRTALAVILPVVLILTSVRLLLTPAFVRLEYATPNFPPDPYGFTREDRVRWALVELDYLLNDEGIEFLGDLRFEGGSALHNARELRHMQDVKRLTQVALRVWAVGGLQSTQVYAKITPRRREAAFQALTAGARLTLILMGALLVALVVGFSVLFVAFHRIFFVGDTWLFPPSDTLIRLFPVRFWRDAFLFAALATLAQAGLLWVVSRWLGR